MKTLFYGGNILTMEDGVQVEAVLVQDGVIEALGTKEALLMTAGECECVDLQGKTLMPAFIDPHSHFFQVAASLLQVSINGADSVEKIGTLVQDFIRSQQIQPGQWVTVRDYDNNIMPDLKNPTLQQLDAICPDSPMVIHHKSGHMGLLNGKALEQVGITADTPSPAGGKIEVKDGKLTGYLEENAFFDALKRIPMADTEQLLRAFSDAQKKYASYGITTVQDGMVVGQMLPMYQLLMSRRQLKLDVVLYCAPDQYDTAVQLVREFPEEKHLQVGGMKMFLDGSPQGRTAWMRQPYAGETDYCAYGTMTDEAVESCFRLAAEKHTQMIAHCNGDAAAEQFLRCLAKAEQEYPVLKELRPVIIHGQLMGTDQLPRAAELGAMVSFFVAHVYHWGDVHIRNFGMERASKISPARTAMDCGVNVTFHQDAPVIEPDMLETVWCAVNRITGNGVQLDRQQAVSVYDALKAVTVNAAAQYGQQAEKGSIAPGKRADLMILDRDPLQTDPMALRDIQVLQTYKDGVCIFTKD